ncbi:YbdK family carboxylate-amine ligase [Streptomyces sp. HUAS MG47]|uniref:carboxylate-amine ligase n=1 Tax=Streptomyces solicamelliae TaxID=3231716 RepID=UPI00387828DA
MGVEEEFVLVGPGSRAPVDRGPEVVESAAHVVGGQVQSEFFNAQVETVSQPTASCQDLRDELVRLRGAIARAARAECCMPVATGVPPVPPARPATVTDARRYRRIAHHFAPHLPAIEDLLSGCHVHIGTLDRALALALSRRIAPWLPVLQAVTANSPFARCRDTGFDSWRSAAYASWPTVGPAPDLDESRYHAHVDALVRNGALVDRRTVYWHARPSEHVPTLEIRVADANADVDTVVMYAALLRALAATLLPDVLGQRPAPKVPFRRLVLAHELAARHGPSGFGIDPYTGRERPATELVERLIDRTLPALDRTGDTDRVLGQWQHIRARGAGAGLQRADYRRRRRVTDVVDALAVLTVAACGPGPQPPEALDPGGERP